MKFTEAQGVQEGYSNKILNLYEWMCSEYDDIYSNTYQAEQGLKELLESKTHAGDCTNQNFTCSLCLVETILNEYHDYIKSSKI